MTGSYMWLQYRSIILHKPSELMQTPEIKGIVPSKTPFTSDASHKFGDPQATCTSEQLAANSEVPTTSLGFIIH